MATADVAPHGPVEPAAKRTRESGRVRAWVSSIPLPLRMILLAAALQSVAWNLATPAFQGPDEKAHFGYIQYLAETGHLPRAQVPASSPASAQKPVSTEARAALTELNLEPIINNQLGKPAWTAADLALWHHAEHLLARGSRADGAGPNPAANNPPLYYALMAVPYRMVVSLPLLKRLFVLRLFNALFYLATIVLVWLTAGEIFGPVRWKQTLAAGAVALEPQMAFMSGVINADNLLIALSAGFLLAALRLVRRGPSAGRVLAPSLIAAAAILTHGRGLALLPVLAVALVVALLTHRKRAAQTLAFAGTAVATVGVAFLAYRLFTGGTGTNSLYGGVIGELNRKTAFHLSGFISSVWNFYFEKLLAFEHLGPKYGYRQVYIEEFYGNFGSLNVYYPKAVMVVFQWLTAVGLVGLLAAVITRRRQVIQAWPSLVVLVALFLTTVGLLHFINYRALLNGENEVLVGRYLLPMISLFGLAIAFTAGALPRRLAPLAAAAILALGVLLSLSGVGFTMFSFYA